MSLPNEIETTVVVPPKPTWCKVENGHGEARFDAEALRTYLETTSDKSWIMRDEIGNVVGVANVNVMREAYLAQSRQLYNNQCR